MFKKARREWLINRYFTTAEEAMFFDQAGKEMAEGDIHFGLYTMALSKSEGDEEKAKAKYLQLRVEVLKQEAAIGETLVEAAEKATEREAKPPLLSDKKTKGDGWY